VIAAVTWTVIAGLIAGWVTSRKVKKRREVLAWQRWMRDTDQAIDVASYPAPHFAQWDRQMRERT